MSASEAALRSAQLAPLTLICLNEAQIKPESKGSATGLGSPGSGGPLLESLWSNNLNPRAESPPQCSRVLLIMTSLLDSGPGGPLLYQNHNQNQNQNQKRTFLRPQLVSTTPSSKPAEYRHATDAAWECKEQMNINFPRRASNQRKTCRVLAKLIWDLQTFLSVLDSENLSYIAQAQKKSISELLSKLQTPDAPAEWFPVFPVEDAEYMVMSCPSSSLGNELDDSPGTDPTFAPCLVVSRCSLVVSADLASGPIGLDEERGEQTSLGKLGKLVSPQGLSKKTDLKKKNPKKNCESLQKSCSGGLENLDETSCFPSYSYHGNTGASLISGKKNGSSSHLGRSESNQTSSLPDLKEELKGKLGGGKKCYKFARDLLPQLELNLHGCQIVYKSKNSAKIQHQLKLVPVGSESLVLGYSSFQQADEWRKAIEEVSTGGEEESQSFSSLSKSDLRLSCRSSTVLTDSDEEKPSTYRSLNRDKGFLNVLMNCQWQSLQCQVEDGVLNMFGEEMEKDEEEEVKRSPQYTVQLRGCEVRDDPDRSYRITLSMLGDQVAVLEVSWQTRATVSSLEEKEKWRKLLQDGAASRGYHDNKTQENTGGVLRWDKRLKTSTSLHDITLFLLSEFKSSSYFLSGLQMRRFPTSNAYMDDPFCLTRTTSSQPLYSNSAPQKALRHGSQDSVHRNSVSSRESVTYSNTVLSSSSESDLDQTFRMNNLTLDQWPQTALLEGQRSAVQSRMAPAVQRDVQKLKLVDTPAVQLRTGSETNLAPAVKRNKRTSFRQSLAICTERAQAGFLNPLLRRTASAKNSLRRAPSALFIEHGKVFQRKKVGQIQLNHQACRRRRSSALIGCLDSNHSDWLKVTNWANWANWANKLTADSLICYHSRSSETFFCLEYRKQQRSDAGAFLLFPFECSLCQSALCRPPQEAAYEGSAPVWVIIFKPRFSSSLLGKKRRYCDIIAGLANRRPRQGRCGN
ncbi:hypothetical protein CCH79_00016199 [Gambusia affinis]|uniref:PH domain-containing protein n=1 Tax=Gambusia affinis TaxID=33528 RepID=A0A315VP50_GAMAF|nr:hypothetical protein CCH79_00016199 [Gambusia affinis]